MGDSLLNRLKKIEGGRSLLEDLESETRYPGGRPVSNVVCETASYLKFFSGTLSLWQIRTVRNGSDDWRVPDGFLTLILAGGGYSSSFFMALLGSSSLFSHLLSSILILVVFREGPVLK